MVLRVAIFWVLLLQTALALASNPPSRTVLVTGGAGYIGSHTCLELLQSGRYQVVVVDNLDNSCELALDRVKELCGGGHSDYIHLRKCDIRDRNTLTAVLEEFPDISSCIHFAGLKVGCSAIYAIQSRDMIEIYLTKILLFLCIGCWGISGQATVVL
jgi:nucleoside-diphosphate-sugar epimerase